jgi:hypothetical protein
MKVREQLRSLAILTQDKKFSLGPGAGMTAVENIS